MSGDAENRMCPCTVEYICSYVWATLHVDVVQNPNYNSLLPASGEHQTLLRQN